MTSRPANSYTRPPTLIDRRPLWPLRPAKLRRRDFANARGDYEQFYEEFFDEKDTELYGADPRTKQRGDTIAAAIRKHLRPGSSILDVGCGLGDVLQMLPAGYRLAGMEYAK